MRFGLVLAIGMLCCWGATPASAQPINDNCADSALFPLAVGANAYDTTGANTDGTQSVCFMFDDAWFQFTAANTVTYVFETCGGAGYDTEIEVWEGTQCPDNLNTWLACNDDACFLQSRVVVPMVSGVTYLLRLGSFSQGFNGPATLTIFEAAPENCSDFIDNDLDGLIDCSDSLDCPSGVPPCFPPSNDDCSTPDTLVVGANNYDTVLATDSPQPNSGCPTGSFWGAMSKDIWWTYTAAAGGPLQVSTCGTFHDTDIEVYEQIGGNPCDTSLSVGCAGDSCGLQSTVTWTATAGTTYIVRLGSWGFGSSGTGPLTFVIGGPEDCADGLDNDFDTLVDCFDPDCAGVGVCPPAPPGDECNTALIAALGPNPYDTAPAFDSPEPFICPGGSFPGQMSKDLWWEFTAPNSVAYRADTCTTFHDTDMQVFEGTCGALVQIACQGDSCGLQTQVSWTAVAGTTYIIRLGSWAQNDFGSGNMVITEGAPENCTDFIDNDFDNLVDCNDVDCAGVPPCPAAAPGDECIVAVPAVLGANPYDTQFAFDSPEPFVCPTASFPGEMSKDIWWTYTAAASVTHRMETCSTFHDTDLEVFEGSCGALIQIGCAGDSCGLMTIVDWTAVAGTTYILRLGSWGQGAFGSGNMNLIEAGPEDCFDGLDNDFDGFTDCGDSVDCGGLPQCNEALNCGDFIDNDLDGLIDCSDTVDCPTGVAPCFPPANDDCSTPDLLVLGANNYDTVLASDSPQPNSGCPGGSFWGAMSKDIWWTYTATGNDPLRVSTCGTFHDTDIEVYEQVGGNPCDTSLSVGCAGDSCGLQSQVTWNGTAGTTYIVRLGSWGAGSSGTGPLTFIVGGPENCTDGLDNDFDVLVDCFDPDCALLPICQEICNDGIDNEGDGFIDCADGECACTGFCPPPTPGDECCSALPVVPGANAFSNVGMTTSSDAYSIATCQFTAFGANQADIWLTWTASITGDAFWDTCDPASYDTDVVIYEGSNCQTKVQIACNGDGFGPTGCQIFFSSGQFPITAGTTYLIRIGAFNAGLFGTGTFNLVETCSAAVANLAGAADCLTGDVSLTWDPAGFDSYDIARNGSVVASALPAGTVSYTDLAVSNGTYLYDVIGNCAGGGGATSSVNVTVATYNGEQDLVVRGETTLGLTDSVAALTAELSSLGRTYVVVDGGIGDYPCNTAPFEIIWNMNGTETGIGAGRNLTFADGAVLLAKQQAGAGIYLESGDQWGFLIVPSDYDQIDGVAFAADGDDTFLGMDGADSGLGLDVLDQQNIPYTQDQAGFDWTDQLTVAPTDPGLAAAAAIWSLDDALGFPYITGVYGQGVAPAGNTIAQSWEFGGFGGDKNDLASRYVAALGGGVAVGQFRRGDCNIDGLLNIADAIFGLGALFPPGGGTPNDPQCDDSCDANDDGGVNIADMITILGNLFPPGGGPPTVIPPPFGVCGPDPTSDAIDCASYPTCP